MSFIGSINFLKNYFLYAGCTEEEFKIANPQMHLNNIITLKTVSIIASAITLICMIVGQSVPNMQSKMFSYIAGFLIFFLITLISFLSKRKPVLVFCMYFFDICLLGVGLMLTLVNAPQQLTITLIPVSMLIPMFFDKKPIKNYLIILTTDLIFTIFAVKTKPADIIVLDITDVFVFSFAGLFIGTVSTQNKIRRFVYSYQIQKIANSDTLSGCFNRFSYNQYLETLKEIPSDFAVVMIDVNGLKKVNDTMGHKAGDELISTVGKNIILAFNENSKSFRIGGDEFIIFLNTNQNKLKNIINELNHNLKNYSSDILHGISVARGICFASDYPGASVNELIQIADQSMYANKAEFYTSIKQ